MFIAVKGVWDDVPVLGAYPISWNERRVLSFAIRRSILKKKSFHLCLKHNSCRCSILKFTAINVLLREYIEVIIKKRIFKLRWLTDTKDYINFGKYVTSKKRLNWIPWLTPFTLQTTLPFQKIVYTAKDKPAYSLTSPPDEEERRVWMGGGGGGPLVGGRLKFSYFVVSRLKFSIFVGTWLNFLIFVGYRKISVNK